MEECRGCGSEFAWQDETLFRSRCDKCVKLCTNVTCGVCGVVFHPQKYDHRAQQCEACSERKIRANWLSWTAGKWGLPDGSDAGWCVFDEPLFVERTRFARPIVEAARRWSRAVGNLVALGPTGIGKTVAIIALAQRLRHVAATDLNVSFADWTFVRDLLFVTAIDLVRARRMHPLGKGEAPLVDSAKKASLLLLDDLGSEGQDTENLFFEVVDYRYRRRTPTVVTSSMTARELGVRYRTVLRRLSDLGEVIEHFEGVPR